MSENGEVKSANKLYLLLGPLHKLTLLCCVADAKYTGGLGSTKHDAAKSETHNAGFSS